MNQKAVRVQEKLLHNNGIAASNMFIIRAGRFREKLTSVWFGL